MRHLLALLAAGLLTVLLGAAPALADPLDGVVSGTVTNKSVEGASPAGDTAYLLVFGVKEQAPIDEKRTSVGPDGRYAFTGVDRDPNLAFFVLVEHQSVQYSNPTPFQLKDEPAHQADVDVYDSTSSDTAIQFDRTNLLVVGVQPGILQVMQMGSVTNTGDRTFVPENPDGGVLARGIRFSVPKGAMGAQMEAGFDPDSVVQSTDGIQVVSPLRPGTQQFAMSFQLPFNGSAADLDLRFNYPAAAFSLYLPQNGPQLEGSTLQSQGSAALGGQQFALYGANGVARDSVLGMRVTGLPSTGGLGLGPTQLAAISAGTVLLVLGAGTLVLSARRRQPTAAVAGAETELPGASDLEQERMQLVMRLASLDERFAAGRIAEVEYQQQRTRGKQRLVELTRALQRVEA